MAAAGCDFLVGDELDSLFIAIEQELLEEKVLTLEVDSVVQEIDEQEKKPEHPCDVCSKVCLSKRGLTRHKNSKHSLLQNVPKTASSSEKRVVKLRDAESLCHPMYFKKYCEICVDKLGKDQCYPDEIRHEFESYLVRLDDTNYTYEFFRSCISNFDGDGEKFYPKFYRIVADTDNLFKDLSVNGCRLLGCEVANLVLSHLSKKKSDKNPSGTVVHDQIFSEKENNVIYYLAGYVFSTLYRRIINNRNKNEYSEQVLSILKAGKLAEDTKIDENVFKLVNSRCRGSLWKVTYDVYNIFSIIECHFRSKTVGLVRKLSSEDIVCSLISDSFLLARFSSVRGAADINVSKEVALDLLEQIITLYVRVRAFSYAKDVVQNHKIAAKSNRSRSLRTEMKKSTTTLEQGH